MQIHPSVCSSTTWLQNLLHRKLRTFQGAAGRLFCANPKKLLSQQPWQGIGILQPIKQSSFSKQLADFALRLWKRPFSDRQIPKVLHVCRGFNGFCFF